MITVGEVCDEKEQLWVSKMERFRNVLVKQEASPVKAFLIGVRLSSRRIIDKLRCLFFGPVVPEMSRRFDSHDKHFYEYERVE